MIKPLNGNVLLKKELKDNTTKRGIVLSQSKEEEEYATVIAISDVYNEKGELIKCELKPGDKVLHKSYGTTKVKDGNEEYLLISYKDILAIIE